METLRPLRIDVLRGAPEFVSGVSLIRGVPTPVVDAEALLGGTRGSPRRLVTLRNAGRQLALAVDEVLGVRELDDHALSSAPALLSAVVSGAVRSVSTLDARLCLTLETARLLPDSVWAALATQAEHS